MNELDVVTLTRDDPVTGLKAGAIGTIVHAHADIAGHPKAFLVEFPGADDPYEPTLADITVDALRPSSAAELATLRQKRVAAE
ncbi:MAG: DUF4926 domain-containing protein [Alphaproteobacteria bacterium]|nr:DUF4926 domain-containing protein [Alphaproteobacteria bacterium]